MHLQCLLLGLLSLLQLAAAGGILAIDYGTEWMKVSLVKPGVPFDVLLNTDSKRKIQSVVALKGEDRWIGGDAANLASRFPDSVYPSVKLLLGHSETDAQAKIYETIYRTSLKTNATTGQIVYKDAAATASSSGLQWPEEALAMQLGHAKKLAKIAAAGESIVDVVVTVPVFFSQAERQSILDAIELAGLKPLALLDDGSAVAINYAMTRTFPTGSAENHLFYDAGAGSIRSTIVSFQTLEVKDTPTAKTTRSVTSAEVKGIGYDRSAGGMIMDSKIRDILEQQFNEKEGSRLETPLAKNKRAQAKLLKEAARVKQVLSANAESPSRVEGLAEDIDFRGAVKRETFEAACADLQPSFSQPIHDALKSANMTMADISSVILVGGVSRVPMVRSAVTAVVGEDKIAQNINADEAAVMGAALYGAGLSKQFKTKDIRVTGLNPYAIQVAYEGESKTAGSARMIASTLFPTFGKTGVQKTMSIKKTVDFPLNFEYKTENKDQILGVATAQISGLTQAFANLTEPEAANATVKVVVELSDSGVLSVPSAQLVLPEVKEASSVADKIKGLFGSKDKKGETEETETGTGKNESETEAATPVKKPAGPIKLRVAFVPGPHVALSQTEKKDSIRRLKDIDQAEVRKHNREEARNGLEAYIYRLRDMLDNSGFVEASTESERVNIRKKLEEASEWLWDAGETAPTKDLKSAKSELERAASPANTRISESAGRESATNELRMGMITAQVFLISAQQQLENDTAAGEPSKYTETELKTLESSISNNEKWMSDLQKKQDTLKKNEDAVLKISELERRRKELSTQLGVLQAKRPPRKPKKTSSSSNSSSSTASTSTVPEASASGTPIEQASSSAPTPTTTLPHARDEL